MTEKSPIITASLLAEYCFASALRRRAILEQMHSDGFEPFKLWYGEVPGAYRQFVACQCEDDEKLCALEAQLVAREARSDDDDHKALKQLDALEHIRHIDHTDLLSKAAASPFDHKVRQLKVSGVTIRVNPTNILVGNHLGRIVQDVGVIKPYLKESRALSEEEGRTFAAILHWFAERELSHIGEATPALCVVTDVFSRKLHFAPNRYKKLHNIIEANCQEISDRWPSFVPRAVGAVRRSHSLK